MTTWLKWGTLANLKFAYRGEKKVKLEVVTARVAPSSANPPPKPPSTFSSDNVEAKGAEKGKEVQTQKGVSAKQMISKGKDNSKRKSRQMRFQRRKTTGKSVWIGPRCCCKSLFFESSGGRGLGASESTKGALVSQMAEWG